MLFLKFSNIHLPRQLDDVTDGDSLLVVDDQLVEAVTQILLPSLDRSNRNRQSGSRQPNVGRAVRSDSSDGQDRVDVLRRKVGTRRVPFVKNFRFSGCDVAQQQVHRSLFEFQIFLNTFVSPKINGVSVTVVSRYLMTTYEIADRPPLS